ncbi:MAG: 4'-phosphopantetheinyl transferase superfamily protein [Actinomycetota bacterium]
MDLRQDIWQQSSGQQSLKDGEIHIWRANLNQESLSVQQFLKTLSADEKQKADKYYFDKDRNHFIVARGTLRKILSGYLGIAPNEICFAYNLFGKPILDVKNNQFRFNVSHSQGLALFAITREREVGIDLEFIRSDFAVLKTAQSFFSEPEISALKNLPTELQTAAFFSIWTRKEAFIKAVGEGFSYPSTKFTVSIMPKNSHDLFRTREFQKVRDWSLMILSCQADYTAALAIEGKIQTVSYWL